MAKANKPEAAAVWMPIGELRPWADNPRDNAAAIPEVAKSIPRFGFASPIIARPIEGGGHEIIAGHTRHQAARSLGLDRGPVRVMDLDPTAPRYLSLGERMACSTFPMDMVWPDGSTKKAGWFMGMSVPPFMMQRIALEVRKQWIQH